MTGNGIRQRALWGNLPHPVFRAAPATPATLHRATDPVPRPRENAVPEQIALSIRGLKFAYPGGDPGAWVVDIAGLDLARAEQMLLTGGSGRGKSTLLQLIAGLLDP